MNKHILKIKIKNKIINLLKQNGFNNDEIKATVRSWEYASLSEKYSHGFDRIIWLVEMVTQKNILPNCFLKIAKKGIFTHIEGKKSLGYLAAEKAVECAIISAKQFGVGIVTISNCYPTGCMGQYTETITESEQIGIAISHSSPRVAAFGTIDKIFSTVGHSFGFPSKNIPYIYDSSVGAITHGAILQYYSSNKPFPLNSVFTEKGVATINPSDVIDEKGIFNGIINIAGDRQANKISGLAGSLELLANLALINGDINTDAYSFFMAIDPSFFGNKVKYKKLVNKLEDKILGARKSNNISNIYYAGQKSFLLRKKNASKKTVRISDNTYKFFDF